MEPILPGVDFGRTIPTPPFRPASIGIANFVGPVQHISIPHEVHARLVVAIDDKQWKSGDSLFDYVHLPVAEHCVDRAAPIATEMLALAKWEVVKDAGGELIVEVELRQPPIRFLRSGEWPVHGTRKCPQTVGEAGIEGARVGIA